MVNLIFYGVLHENIREVPYCPSVMDWELEKIEFDGCICVHFKTIPVRHLSL